MYDLVERFFFSAKGVVFVFVALACNLVFCLEWISSFTFLNFSSLSFVANRFANILFGTAAVILPVAYGCFVTIKKQGRV